MSMLADFEKKLAALRARRQAMVPGLCRMIDGARPGEQREKRYYHVGRKIRRQIEEEERIERAIRAAMSAEQSRSAE